MPKRLTAFFLIFFIAAACSPSPHAVQTAIAQTQASFTSTPTIIPCTSRGWEEINDDLKLFYQQAKSLYVGMDKQAYLDNLRSYRIKISVVEIDPCSESARQTVLISVGSIITGMEFSINEEGAQSISTDMLTTGMIGLQDANAQLAALHILVVLSLE